MRVSTAFSLLSAVAGTQVAAQSSATTTVTTASTSTIVAATAVNSNPPGKVYKATLPEEAFFKAAYPEGGNVKGEIVAVANPDKSGVMFNVKFSNLPKTGGPFTYHLHVAPVPENGNCTATLAHLDPTARGEDPPCNMDAKETCQVGDLSGKYGKIPEGVDPWTATYTDPYASTVDNLGAFFGNRSFVIHYSNKTRISCANFELIVQSGLPSASACSTEKAPVPTVSGSGMSNVTIPSTIGPVPTTVQTPPAPSATTVVTAAGSTITVGGASAFVLAAAIMFML
ncbi:superoxide dismutase [Apodospora peruviana]|uniref:superoxide dismutase n=1 Tax=Apodospora peruviana TaxID=516989 RepID=A0AAE0IQW6_9PEZI|nr:superoxide dismutase [Apodospora peruviana]